METNNPRSPVEDTKVKEFFLEQFKKDSLEIAHNDQFFHSLLKLYFTLLSGLWLGLSAIYAWRVQKWAIPWRTDFFTTMRTECIVIAGILLIIGIAIYWFHLSKRKMNTDIIVDIMLIRAAFVQCSDNPEDAKKYLFFQPLPPLKSMVSAKAKEVKKLIKYSRLTGMDASCMYVCASLNAIMLYAIATLYRVPATSLWLGEVSTAALYAIAFLLLQVLIYWRYLCRSDKRLRQKLSKQLAKNEQKPKKDGET